MKESYSIDGMTFEEYLKDRTNIFFKPIIQIKNYLLNIIDSNFILPNKNIVNTLEVFNSQHIEILKNHTK